MNHIKVARDTLGYLQYKNVMTNFLFQNASSTSSNYDEIFATPCFEKKLISFKTACEQEEEHKDKTPIPSAKSEQIVDEFYDVLGEEEGMYYRMATSIEKEDLSDLPENNWSGYFKGYSILHEKQEFCINENKKCIELTDDMGACDLDEYLSELKYCYKNTL